MDPSTTNPDSPSPVPETRETSLVARLMNMVAAPGEVFEEIKPRPVATANWLVPTLVVAVLGVISALWIGSQATIKRQQLEMQDAVFQKMIESGKMTQADADRARQGAEATGGIKQVFGAVAAPVGTFLGLFWSALLVWLGGLIFGQRFGYMRAVEVVGLAGMISVLGLIVKTLLIVVMGSLFAGPTPALLLSKFDPMNTWHGVLAALDVFALWAMGVQACGLAKITGVSYGKAAAWVFGVWLALAAVLFVGGLAIRKAMGF
jgi:Yip1 domain